MYTVAYNYCTSSRMSQNSAEGGLGGGSATRSECSAFTCGEIMTDLMLSSAGANVMGADLYGHLTNYFQHHLRGVRKVRLKSLSTTCSALTVTY
jgi:cullin 1